MEKWKALVNLAYMLNALKIKSASNTLLWATQKLIEKEATATIMTMRNEGGL